MATFAETKVTLDEIARKTDSLKKANDNLLVRATSNETQLQNMQTEYSGFATQLNADAAANAGDPAWDAAKAEKDALQSEFVTEKARATAIKGALTGL